MAARPPGGPGSRCLVLLILLWACLGQQVALADSAGWLGHRHQQQQQQHHNGDGAGSLLQDPSPASRSRVHQPGLGSGAAAPRPGASEQQQVFSSSARNAEQQATAQAAQSAQERDGNPGHSSRPKVPLLAVTCMSAVMALMSCLGVLPYFFCAKLSKPWAGVANAVASGVMLAASFGLLAEGAPYGGTYLILGMLLGVVFVKFSQEHLEQYEVDSFEQLAGADARKVILFLAVMAVHAVGEGGGVGVSFAGDRGWAQGTLVTLAIGLHNVPEGLAVATVMAAKGTSPRRTLLWTALTALPQALVAPPAYVFVDTFRAMLPLAMGFAAGCMIWVVLAELLPDALEAVDSEKVATCATASAAWLQGLSIWIAHLETPSGTLASPFGNYTAVLPLGITPLLPQLAPAIILPTLLAAAGTRLSLPPVLLTAASAGLLASYAGACWVQLVISSPHRVLGGLLAPAVGAAVAAALWRQLRSWQQQQGWCLGGLKLKAGGSSSGSWQGHEASGCATLIGALPSHKSPGTASSNSSDDSSNNSSSEAYLKLPGAHLPRLGEGLQQQHQQHGGLVLTAPTAPYAGCTQMRHQRTSESGQQQQQGAWDESSAAGGCSSTSSSSSNSPLRGTAGAHTHSLLLPGKGDVLLHMGMLGDSSAAAAGAGGPAGSWQGHRGQQRKQRDSWSAFAGLPSVSRVHGSSQAVAAASMLCVVGTAAAGVPLGLQLAAALTADPTNSGHVVVPTVLLGTVLSLGCLGFLTLLLGTRRRTITAAAGLISSMPVLVALAALLSQPGWVGQGSAGAAADGLQGLAAGFNAVVVLLLLLPAVTQWGPKAAAVGAWSGAAAGLVLCAGVAALCFGTPYCLHVPPVSSSTA